MFDITTGQFIGNIAPFNGSDVNTLGVCTDPTLDNNMFLYLVIGSMATNIYDYWTNQALWSYG